MQQRAREASNFKHNILLLYYGLGNCIFIIGTYHDINSDLAVWNIIGQA